MELSLEEEDSVNAWLDVSSFGTHETFDKAREQIKLRVEQASAPQIKENSL